VGTRLLERADRTTSLLLKRAELCVERGVDKGRSASFARLSLKVGTAGDNDLVLSDEAVSARHCEIFATEQGFLLTDLGSTNGTFVNDVRIGAAYLTKSISIGLGSSSLRFEIDRPDVEIPLSAKTNFGTLLGHSPAMRAVFAVLEQAARSDATVLLLGESGTGKELAARAIHEHSGRKDGPFIVFDCGAASPTLIESQLFGHLRGAFTGATDSRTGVFEAASGGTLVLDEIGELASELQPKLLRALEERKVQRLGENVPRPVDVRFVACTNRNLEEEVRANRFRQDLLYRLSVVSVYLPPLRERKEELPRLIRHFISRLGGDAEQVLAPDLMKMVFAHDWRGNVRELRNFVERFLALPTLSPAALLRNSPIARSSEQVVQPMADRPFHDAKQRWTDAFERAYLAELLDQHGGNISAVARAAELSRQTCYRLILKHGLRTD
jgi:DNA-binding NtrC family response regulator